MSRLSVVNPADIFVLVRQFPQPGASFNVVAGDRAYPNIEYEHIITNFVVDNWWNILLLATDN